ncbi:MAG: hypothetical protein ABIS28_08325 [Caldimonas sp.]
MAFDRGTILAALKSALISEIEFELKADRAAAMIVSANAAALKHGQWPSTVSQGQRADRVSSGCVLVTGGRLSATF